MDEKSLQVLEFPKVIRELADFTSFAVSREMAESLAPSTDAEMIVLLLKQSAEARQLLSLSPSFSIGEARDVRWAVDMAMRGKVLDPQTLIDVQSTLATASEVRFTLRNVENELPSLWDIAEQIIVLPSLEREIGRCIDPSGEILDSASALLAELRQELKTTRRQLLNKLENLISSPTIQNMLQDSLITEREGRYVIPIKMEFQGEMKGIIHDISNTGATVFIEPWATVESGNILKQLALDEQREIQRILASLSDEVGASSPEIFRNMKLLAELDLALAKTRYARSVNAIEPLISPAGVLKLVNARHPLLKENAVPLSVEIGSDFKALVITGPNTGGKTVSIKTIGLLVLMTQAGIPIPASGESCVPIFDSVFADIGDEQSIEQTLSTFSWHMGNIVRIIRMSTERSLVLLDELGSSTDPSQGAALAQAILLHLLARQTLAVATTHYSELKIFAYATDGMQNASLEFDPVTLTPTYQLIVGIPGGSNALAVASQLGLPSGIIDAASEMLPKGTSEVEVLLSELTNERQAIRTLRVDLEKEKYTATELKDRLEGELQSVKDREQSLLQEARERISGEAARLQQQIRQVAAELKKAKSKKSIDEAKGTLKAVREEMDAPAWQIQSDSGQETTEAVDISVGDSVRVIDTTLKGTVLSLPEKGGQVELQVGHTRMLTALENLERVPSSMENLSPPAYIMKKDPAKTRRSLELDLRGKRAEEVESELDAYLNDVSLAGFTEVRIIHGYGTGTVRQIVRDMLVSYPLIKAFRSGEWGEGGDGVTIVKL